MLYTVKGTLPFHLASHAPCVGAHLTVVHLGEPEGGSRKGTLQNILIYNQTLSANGPVYEAMSLIFKLCV